MPATPRQLIAGNWKMNGLRRSLAELNAVAAGYDAKLRRACDFVICPPTTLVYLAASAALGTGIGIGAQDCHIEASGAFTGEISAEMLADCGATCVIVGHSERRSYFAETDGDVKTKAQAALRAGLVPIICIGETNSDRESGRTLAVLKRQLLGSVPVSESGALVIAYEPVWAIGTGEVASPEDAQEVCGAIRGRLSAIPGDGEAAGVRILYGGSVKADNIASIMTQPDIDGALVGGASLDAGEFARICRYRELAVGA